MKYKYLADAQTETIGGHYVKRPVIEIELSKKGHKSRKFIAIIDSGADHILMSTEIAELFGINWRKSRTRKITGISMQQQDGYVGEINLSVSHIGETLTMPVLFINFRIPILLGQEGFFDNYRIKFEKDHDTFEITKPPSK
ncbi:MAG: hypothetical protein AAB507_02145 [Patescibacteria group bacterium]